MSTSGDKSFPYSESDPTYSGASNELLLEFLDSVMYKRFDASLLLCQKIIEAEPDNYEARAFLPMLEEANILKSTGYFTPLDVETSSESSESSIEESERRRERRESSSSSDEWDYSTTTSDSDSSDDDG
ncbi:unnamed protein product [Hymenolepis diminuta]|uniref:TPR_REGION domain-containing protein n=1 Tax=Hymenolepis diminuta TaxID=6216 RepID=A0A0R3STR6_HYMDI|nr:unnamed protein product [Hymenolepis diminuta]VUZ48034.1 unnamed protein product [Hymenolepis diminuta]